MTIEVPTLLQIVGFVFQVIPNIEPYSAPALLKGIFTGSSFSLCFEWLWMLFSSVKPEMCWSTPLVFQVEPPYYISRNIRNYTHLFHLNQSIGMWISKSLKDADWTSCSQWGAFAADCQRLRVGHQDDYVAIDREQVTWARCPLRPSCVEWYWLKWE